MSQKEPPIDASDWHACQLDPSENFIGHAEFRLKDGTYRDIKVKISGVVKEKLPWQPKRDKPKTCVSFEGKTKRMTLNATRRKSIVALHGSMVRGWIGKDITLYWDKTVRNPSGGEPGGVRIRAKESK